jgi:hypothetical protein
VQEIAFAKKAILHVGQEKIQWQDFSDAVMLMDERSEDIVRLLTRHDHQKVEARAFDQIEIRAPGAQSLIEVLNHLFRTTSKGRFDRLASVETLISTLSSYDVWAPKDAVFAILRLAKDTHGVKDDKIDVETSTDKSILQVFTEFVDFTISASKSLDIICLPWAPSPNPPRDEDALQEQFPKPIKVTLPSWIAPIHKRAFDKLDKHPNRYFSRVNADSLVGRLGLKSYKVSGDSQLKPHSITIENGEYCLHVQGRKLGEIGELGECAIDGVLPFTWLDMANRVENDPPSDSDEEDGAKRSVCQPTQRPKRAARRKGGVPHIPVAFWRTLVADRGPGGLAPPGWYRRLCKEVFSQPPARQRGKKEKVFTDEEINLAMINARGRMNRPAVQFLRRVQASTWNRRFITKDTKKLGLAPAEAKVGDWICMLWGCSVPVVLRQLTTRNGKESGYFKLIGDCYVHGIMNGEMLDKNPKMPDLKDGRKFSIL